VTARNFDTAALRRSVLAAWTASPARFREDANAEEELVLGAYRDRLVVELAQNAADAAVRAGVAGRVRFRLREGVLTAANTGAPLDAAGVVALSTLRASAKRDEASVGRFGVGFAATLAVSPAPEIHSRTGAVRWSAEATRAELAGIEALAEEVARRDGAVPVLRLPFDVPPVVPEGFDTVVVLPLRDGATVDAVNAALDVVDDALLLALPGLGCIEVETPAGSRALVAHRTGEWVDISDGTTSTRWRVCTRGGRLDAALLADRPVEERARPDWSLTWAVPITDGAVALIPAATPPVLHAPTPTDDPLDLPALLLGTFPLDSGRRRVAPGVLLDHLIDQAADAYSDLVRDLAADQAVLPLVPGPLGVGEFDAALRREILARLPDVPFLPAAAGGRRLTPREAVLLPGAEPDLLDLLADVIPGLLSGEITGTVPERLGASVLSLADVVDSLVELEREPAWWARLYGAVSGHDVEALRGLPVPLADGRLVRDPRSLWLPGPVAAETLGVLGLRAVHPGAVHPLLERLGARAATPASLLADPGLRLALDLQDASDEEREAVVEALLTVVAADPPAEPLPWTAENLPLPAEDGELEAAGDLLLPDSPLREILRAEDVAVVAPEVVERFGADTLRAVGVLESFALIRESDVTVDSAEVDHDLDGEEQWLRSLVDAAPAAPEYISEFVAVRDLDLVPDDAWPAALRLLARPPLRAAVLEPARVLYRDGRVVDVPSYTSWWLRGRPILDGARPVDLRLPDGDPRLVGLWDTAPDGLDPQFARGLGIRVSLTDVLADPDGPADLLARLADPARNLTADQLGAVYAAVAHVDPDRVPAPYRVRVPDGTATRVVAADEVVVVDAPDLLPVVAGHALPAPLRDAGPLAEVLDLPVASVILTGFVCSTGAEVEVPAVVHRVLPGAPSTYVEHADLVVAGPHRDVEVEWRFLDGVLHASTTRGLGFGLAWAAGAWEKRWLMCAALEDPDGLAELLIFDAFG
jgi:hypothetical protein